MIEKIYTGYPILDFLENDFKKLIDQEIIYGATSNPAIFQNAIASPNLASWKIKGNNSTLILDNYEDLC